MLIDVLLGTFHNETPEGIAEELATLESLRRMRVGEGGAMDRRSARELDWPSAQMLTQANCGSEKDSEYEPAWAPISSILRRKVPWNVNDAEDLWFVLTPCIRLTYAQWSTDILG